jgi:hypothetical protein
MSLPRARWLEAARAVWPHRPPVRGRRRLLVAALAGPVLYRSERLFSSTSFIAYFSVADPDLGSGDFLTPGPHWIRDGQPGTYFRKLGNYGIFWVKIFKIFDTDPGSGMKKIRIRDPG